MAYNPTEHSYTASIEGWGIHGDTMTDAGVPVRELEPIGDCILTPGDPSPVGRTKDGDLAYIAKPEAPGLWYLVHYNYDYDESTRAFRTREEALADIAGNFDVFEGDDDEDEEGEEPKAKILPGSADFWRRVWDAYEAGDWKGFSFHSFNPATGELRNIEAKA